MVVFSPILWAGLWGCSEPPEVKYPPIERGDVAACVGNNLGIAFDFVELNYKVEGVVEENAPGIEFNLAPCEIANSDVLRVRSADGVRWAFGWRITDRAGRDVAPAANIAAGTEVEVVFRGDVEGKAHSGFVVSDANGLVAVVDANDQYKALADDDVLPLSVNYGAWQTTNDLECGTANGYEIDFVGDESKSIAPFAQDTLMVGGRTMDIFAISALEYEGGESACRGVGNQLSWAAFRQELIVPEDTTTGTTTTGGSDTGDTGSTTTGTTETGDTGAATTTS